MSSHRVGVRLFVMALVVIAVVMVLISTSGGRSERIHPHTQVRPGRLRAPGPTGRQLMASPPSMTAQTVGLPTSSSPRAEEDVPLPRGVIPGWRPVFAEDFPASEWAPSAAFGSCVWHGLVTMSVCSNLPVAARGRWFAFPDGSASLLAAGVFEPSQVLSIGRGGLTFRLPSASQNLELAGAIPKLGLTPVDTLTSGLYVIRFHADRVPGYDFVFNLWPPDNDIRRTGYIQFPTGSLADNIQALVYDPGHRRTGNIYDPLHPLASDWDTGKRYVGWHTAVVERTRNKIEFYLDGQPIGIDNQAVPRSPLMLMLQTTPQDEQARTVTGGHISVRWLEIYRPRARSAT
jgi:hypothetical protein